LTALQALVLGLIQGLTEFLPVSSTAHLRVVPALLGWDDPGAAFTAVIQGGTLAAVLVYFRADLLRLARAFVAGLAARRPLGSADARMAWMIAAGTVPIVVCGVVLKNQIETSFRSLSVIAAALIVLALLLAWAEGLVARRRRAGVRDLDLGDVGWREALLVGCAQALALVPGTSRSGVTLTAGLLLGLARPAAARFSFLLSVPSVLAAGVYELYRERDHLLASSGDAGNLLLASVVSGVVGYASIAFLLGYLKRHSTWVFVLYRLALGGLLLGLLAGGRLGE
jgi:undecaprenyl-diphosphatase